MPAKARIGTSGFSYPHWREVFYPHGVPQSRWLEHFAEHFDTVELNNTFYQMPREKICDGWKTRTPDDFLFVVKLNQMITHRKKLVEVHALLDEYLRSVDHLQEKLGPILVQLPPKVKVNPSNLHKFLNLCPRSYHWAVEFRHDSWLCEETYEVLRNHKAALVIHDLIEDHAREITADFVYLRFHGPVKYAGCYTQKQLRAWSEQIREYLAQGLNVYAYFNNDAQGYAIRNAQDLKRLTATEK